MVVKYRFGNGGTGAATTAIPAPAGSAPVFVMVAVVAQAGQIVRQNVPVARGKPVVGYDFTQRSDDRIQLGLVVPARRQLALKIG